MDPKDIRNLQEAYNSVYDDDLREEQEFKSWVTELLDEGYDLSDYTWNEMYDIYNEGYKDLGDKARDKGHQLLNKSKKTATRGNMYTGTLPSNTPEGENLKQRASQQFAVSAFHNPEKSQAKAAANKERGEGKKKAFGNRLTRSDKQGIKDSYDLYDIILSHLLDEGYADTIENAESIMVNMSEDWRDSIFEELTGERKKMALEKGGYLAKRVASGKEGQPLERRNRSGDITMSTTMKGPTNRGGGGIKGRIKSDLYGNDETHGGGNKSRRRRGMKVTDTSDEL